MKYATMILTMCMVLLGLNHASATNYTATKTGNWSDTKIWVGGGSIPGSGDNVTINSGVVVTIDANAACNALTINSGGTLNAGAHTCEIYGSWVNNGSFNCGTSLIVFRGGALQSISGIASTFQNVTIWNASGVTMNTNMTVDGGLVFSSGKLNTGSYTCTLGPSAAITGESGGQYLVGNCTMTRSNVTITTTNETFGGIGVELKTTSGTQSLGNVTITRMSGPGSAATIGSSASINRKWTISVGTQPTASVSVTLRWVSDDNNGKIFTANYAQMWRSSDGVSNWNPVGSQDIATRDLNDQALWSLAAATAGFSTFTISDQGNALPVELTSFTANRIGSTIALAWRTATEANNHGFEIERSVNSGAWESIGFVAGAGTSNTPRAYSFRDDAAALQNTASTIAYRLRQIDRDGTTEYSSTVTVTVAPAASGIVLRQNYPNPFNPSTNISFSLPSSDRVTLAVYNEIGTEVARLYDNTELAAGQHTAAFDGTSLPSGVYLCRLSSAGSTPQTIRMLVSK